MTRLLDCLRWLGALTLRELAHALQRSTATVRRTLTRAGIRRGSDGRYHLPLPMQGPRCPPESVFAVRECLDGEPVYADWLSERTGYSMGIVHRALRWLGYAATTRGRSAVWVLR